MFGVDKSVRKAMSDLVNIKDSSLNRTADMDEAYEGLAYDGSTYKKIKGSYDFYQTNRTMKRKASDYLNPHQSDEYFLNAQPYGKKRSNEARMNPEPYGEKQQFYGPRGHDHSKCLLIRKQRKERSPDFRPFLFLTDGEEYFLPSPSPSNKREPNIVLGNDDMPVFDDDHYHESMLKFKDYMVKAMDKVMNKVKARAIFAKGIGKDHV